MSRRSPDVYSRFDSISRRHRCEKSRSRLATDSEPQAGQACMGPNNPSSPRAFVSLRSFGLLIVARTRRTPVRRGPPPRVRGRQRPAASPTRPRRFRSARRRAGMQSTAFAEHRCPGGESGIPRGRSPEARSPKGQAARRRCAYRPRPVGRSKPTPKIELWSP